MKQSKSIPYFFIILIGMICFFGGLLNIRVLRYIMPDYLLMESYDWLTEIGIIFIFIGISLFLLKKYKIVKKDKQLRVLESILLIILLVTSASTCGWLYGNYQKTLLLSTTNINKMNEQLKMLDQMKTNSPFYCKKIIIRNDDVGDSRYINSVKWISDLCINSNIKMVFAVIPANLINNSKIVNYLNSLDREHFEFATHGFEHIHFQGLPIEKQQSLIENGTKIINEYLNYKPVSFVPPQSSSDVNTTKALRLLDYHCITDMLGYPSYISNFINDFAFETQYNPPKHHNFEEFKNNFDKFYNSSDEYYMLTLHDWTFLDEQGNLDLSQTYIFENAVEYIKNKNIQFMTLDDSYQWHIDEYTIKTGMMSEYKYFIDLKACRYNHSIKFNTPISWNGNVYVLDNINGTITTYLQRVFEFEGEKGHLYEIYLGE